MKQQAKYRFFNKILRQEAAVLQDCCQNADPRPSRNQDEPDQYL